MKTIDELLTFTSGVVAASVSKMGSTIYDTLFNRLNNDGYISVIDDLLTMLYGSRSLRDVLTTDELTASLAEMRIKTYLFSRAEYFKKCLLYIDAEYNPVENYAGEETERTTFTGGERHSEHTETYGEDKTTHAEGARSSTDIYGAQSSTETPANYSETITYADESTTRSTAPFESDTFHNREKEVTERGSDGDVREMVYDNDISRSESSHTDSHSTSPVTDSDTRASRTDGGSNDSNEYIDTTVREFERHGNIGVLSAGELMTKDSDFWRSFNWLRDTAHDIANIISSGVWAL